MKHRRRPDSARLILHIRIKVQFLLVKAIFNKEMAKLRMKKSLTEKRKKVIDENPGR
jgi:hypothetical protein